MIIEQELYDDLNRVGIKAVVGTARSGKTAFVHYLFEKVYRERRCVLYKVPMSVSEHMPERIKVINSVREIEEGDVVFIDDAALTAAARSHSSKQNVQLTNALTIISHWDCVLIVSIQNLRMLDILFASVQDFMLFQKLGDWQNLMLTRAEFKATLISGQVLLEKHARQKPKLDYRSFVLYHGNFRIYKTVLASWWNDYLSRPYKDYRFDDVEDLRI